MKLLIKPCSLKAISLALLSITFFIPLQSQAEPEKKTVTSLNQIATPEEAKALFNWAMVYLEVNGRDIAYKAFNDADGNFVERDLYLFCLDFDKNWKVMGANKALVGQNAAGRKDLNGKDFVAEFIEIAKTKGSGTSSYTYKNPVTNEVHLKTSFIQKVADKEFCGMGYYKQ